MAKYRKKSVVIEATQWFKKGDHEGVKCYTHAPGDCICSTCRHIWSEHGFIEQGPNSFVVCPGNWVITWTSGLKYTTYWPDEFNQLYEKA